MENTPTQPPPQLAVVPIATISLAMMPDQSNVAVQMSGDALLHLKMLAGAINVVEQRLEQERKPAPLIATPPPHLRLVK